MSLAPSLGLQNTLQTDPVEVCFKVQNDVLEYHITLDVHGFNFGPQREKLPIMKSLLFLWLIDLIIDINAFWRMIFYDQFETNIFCSSELTIQNNFCS